MLYALNLHIDVCQLFPNKTEKKCFFLKNMLLFAQQEGIKKQHASKGKLNIKF